MMLYHLCAVEVSPPKTIAQYSVPITEFYTYYIAGKMSTLKAQTNKLNSEIKSYIFFSLSNSMQMKACNHLNRR